MANNSILKRISIQSETNSDLGDEIYIIIYEEIESLYKIEHHSELDTELNEEPKTYEFDSWLEVKNYLINNIQKTTILSNDDFSVNGWIQDTEKRIPISIKERYGKGLKETKLESGIVYFESKNDNKGRVFHYQPTSYKENPSYAGSEMELDVSTINGFRLLTERTYEIYSLCKTIKG